MPPLNLDTARRLFPDDASVAKRDHRPTRVLLVGSGNFLRAFAAWMIDRLNREGLFDGNIVIAQATATSKTTAAINAQDGLFTVLLRGLLSRREVDHAELITSVRGAINPYADWDAYLDLACSPDLRFVISNTTEAGITYEQQPRPSAACSATFPAQMTAVLYERFARLKADLDKGLIFLPCELIERNGRTLREIIMRHAADWRFDAAFTEWLDAACIFCDTLVDRIVTGYPVDEADALRERLGYDDHLLAAAEPYCNWIIEAAAPSGVRSGDSQSANDRIAAELPLTGAGMNVQFAADVTPYRTRKVRILNGAHTLMVPAAVLAGIETVREAVEDATIGDYLQRGLYDEILPTLDLPADDARAFAEATLERFGNPFIAHRLLSIALNCVSKWKVRVLPSLLEYVRRRGSLPEMLTHSLAMLIRLYRGRLTDDGRLHCDPARSPSSDRAAKPYTLTDEPAVLETFARQWSQYETDHDTARLVTTLLADTTLWATDLTAVPGLTARVTHDLKEQLG